MEHKQQGNSTSPVDARQPQEVGAVEPKWTPGPWRMDSDGWCIEAERYENQPVIAACPDLVEALQAYIAITKTPELYGQLPVFLRDFTEQARAALKKAGV